ncbi:MAG TPA: glutathione S-transferase N-terminal domain-containing protein [Geminicoccus sp.]|jgi:glutathione S-transferase|uniref:glutathione S-transferase N-terminal domain-containing protein n=1 Tax=Geminicoccus sp. TaxID=2024832 RepID=UPI002E344097|nr:glutathione S-transferase N-terminal domain-containing protein [Geminicoccus sp.]HEX2528766.1 glutathione S-transferase N-terminal domain-containing protein [Geminicoccus sp.]
MQLITLPLSPFGRKAHIVALEKGLDLEIVAPPSGLDPSVAAKNPLAKVPVLALATGDALYDSPVICEYFDTIGNGALLIPTGDERWPVLRRMALADGIMDAAVAARQESIRPDGERSQAFMDKQRQSIVRSVDAAAGELQSFAGQLRLDSIAMAVALTYLDVRHPGIDWRSRAPELDRWHAEMEKRPSFAATKPAA